MAPEQFKGECDPRTDIYALGLVLFEMANGKRMALGEAVKAPSALLKHVLERCLAPDPDERWQAASDVRRELEWVANAPSESGPAARRKTGVGIAGWVAASVLLIALGIVFFRPTAVKDLQRFTIAAPEHTTSIHSFAISPDGRYLALAAAVNGKRQLWLRPLDVPQAQPMPATEDAMYPFWSPDSRYIGFFAQGKLKKISAGGGPVQSLCDAESGRGGSWNREGVILFAPNGTFAGIQRVSADGGAPANVTVNKGGAKHPVFLPDGRHFVYLWVDETSGRSGLYWGSLDGGESRNILPDLSSVVFVAGRLLFVRDNTLVSQFFDVGSGQIKGGVAPIAADVSRTSNIDYAPVSASESGLLVYQSGGMRGGKQIAWYDRGGKLLGAVVAQGRVDCPAISPDEKSVAFSRQAVAGVDLWLWDQGRGVERRFTTDVSVNSVPFWSPKGDRILFLSERSGTADLYQRLLSGAGQDEPLLATGNNKLATQWSMDGRFIVYFEIHPKTKQDLWVLPMDGPEKGKPIPFLRSEFNESQGQLAPDSRWMAYTSDESGQNEVYVRPFPAADGQWKISLAGGEQPRWRGDGKELFFEASDGKMMAAKVKASAGAGTGTATSFEPERPEPLFEAHLADSPHWPAFEYDVTRDGKRFLVATQTEGPAALNVVVNWISEPKK
jgi:Tol biopolymer transport system component